ncbi:dicarboxylate/amino acid:cation symporter [Anaerococcus porci]|uniref:dicarboxylate/amino acid:cation symporter n=1 Tax=Anaerococcus porci TaxID=2652269 RepID=UPI002A7556D6|nr:dicarboxylate/amino acid:cation symporter [Anaerococcus porci]MDY3006356.1 dicarboxylate/amino acid:cation symporter [Anaerococcus porci]
MKFLVLFIGFILFYGLSFMKKKGISFGIRVISGAILGIILGFLFKDSTEYIGVFGRIYANLLFALVIPILLASVIKIVISTENLANLRSMGLKTIGVLSLHNVLGSLIGVVLAVLFKIGKNANIPIETSNEVKEVPGFADAFVNFFPKNIVADASKGSVIPIIVFAVLIGLSVLQLIERGKDKEVKPFVDFIESFSEIIFRLIGFVTDFTPYAVLSLLASSIGRIDYSAVKPLLFILILTYIASVFHSYITTGAMIGIIGKLNPFKFFKKNWPVQAIGFTTQSSVGSIGANIENLTKNMGVSEKVASFVAPMGATMGMPGCAGFWPVMSALLTVNVLRINYSISDYIMLVFVALLVSLGTVGVPGTATITTTAVFAAMGLPIEMVVILSPISSLADMGRTATNVTAAASSALIVASSENEIDRSIYNN